MTIIALSNHESGQGPNELERANTGPVLVTEQRRNIADALVLPGVENIEFDPPYANIVMRAAGFE